MTVLGLDAARRHAGELRDKAQAALARSGLADASCLRLLADRVVERDMTWPLDTRERRLDAHGSPMKHTLLESIASPADVRRLSRDRAEAARRRAARLRACRASSQTGGHLSSNLGTVELTIALHYVFNTPHDRLVWDVGHQTYPHKVLTGRRERMATLRQLGGISRLSAPRRERVRHLRHRALVDLDLGRARHGRRRAAEGRGPQGGRDHRRRRDDRRHGLRGAEQRRRRRSADMLVVLNDNDMSISPPVGALNRYLARLMSGKFYAAARDTAKRC